MDKLDEIRSVLVVEDEQDLRDVLLDLLKPLRFQVDFATNGMEALVAAKAHFYDAIITDLMMPKMTGGEFLVELKKSRIDTPVIVLTGSPEKAFVIDALRMGAVDFIEKPFDPTVFLTVIERAVEIGRRRKRLEFEVEKALTQQDNGEATLKEIEKQKMMISYLQVSNHAKRR